jgi:hypothetical protein
VECRGRKSNSNTVLSSLIANANAGICDAGANLIAPLAFTNAAFGELKSSSF